MLSKSATNSLRLFYSALFLLGSQAAYAVNISGTVWNDINTDTLMGHASSNVLGTNILTQADATQVGDLAANTYGDPAVIDAGVENGVESIELCVTGTATCTTTDANGDYTLDVPPGESITVTAPVGFKFSSDDPAGDNDADQQAAAPTPPDPWTALISSASITAGNTDAGLRPLPEIQLAFLDLNAIPADGVQGIETGTPVYNVFGNCTTSAPYTDPADAQLNSATEAGDDCHKYDDTVRTNDLITYTPLR